MITKNKVLLCILLIIVFLIIFSKNLSFYVLYVKEYPNKRLFFQQIISPGNQFGLKYNHSVAKTTVWEFFTIDKDGKLLLTETQFCDHGAGLPYAAFKDEIFISEDGLFKIKNMSREILLPLYYRIGKDSENHFFYKQDINLSQRMGDGVVIIDIRPINLFDYLINNIYRLGGNDYEQQ